MQSNFVDVTNTKPSLTEVSGRRLNKRSVLLGISMWLMKDFAETAVTMRAVLCC